MTAAAIDARGLGKDFGAIRALDALDLEVREAEFFGLLGPNGAGKTTTIHLLATLLRPTRGTALVAGYDVVREDLETRRRIGLVFQETTLDRDLTVEQNLRFAGTVADRHYVMERGRIVDEIPNAALHGSMERVQQYLGV